MRLASPAMQHGAGPVQPPGDILAALRMATREAHDRLETMLGLADAGLAALRYRAVLARLLGFWRGWEPRVAAALAEPDFLAPRLRSELLRRDLAALGLGEAVIAALPDCVPPRLAGPAAALGSLYVMEGSMLGGRVLTRHFAHSLGLGEGVPGSLYFSGHGAATGAIWAGFCARLRQASPDDAGEIVAAACATFAVLADWLAPVGVAPRRSPA